MDKNGIIQCSIGKKSFELEHLLGNATALMEAILKAKPAASKGTYLKEGCGFDHDGAWFAHRTGLCDRPWSRARNGTRHYADANAQKEEQVAELREKFGRATCVFVADYRGLTVEALEKLRGSIYAVIQATNTSTA